MITRIACLLTTAISMGGTVSATAQEAPRPIGAQIRSAVNANPSIHTHTVAQRQDVSDQYRWHNGRWWYQTRDGRWMFWADNRWNVADRARIGGPRGNFGAGYRGSIDYDRRYNDYRGRDYGYPGRYDDRYRYDDRWGRRDYPYGRSYHRGYRGNRGYGYPYQDWNRGYGGYYGAPGYGYGYPGYGGYYNRGAIIGEDIGGQIGGAIGGGYGAGVGAGIGAGIGAQIEDRERRRDR